ncbi:MAG: stage III sporulation protein AF [Lachnospiraceae bacterium]|nr:stage III sporulation protein AF [Lachnospiraceae bacterium]
MLYDFLEFIKRIGIFLICAECLLYFAPGNSYQKYIRVLVGFMILMQFMVPVRTMLGGNDLADIESQVNEFRVEMEKMTAETNYDFISLVPDQNKVIENQIKEEIKLRFNEIDAVENSNYIVHDVKIGDITSVILMKKSTETNSYDNEAIKIKNVSVEKIDFNDKSSFNKSAKNQHDNEVTIIKQVLCQELGISSEKLEVIVIE